jgi:hypothetical protein
MEGVKEGFRGLPGSGFVLIQIELMQLLPFQNHETWSLTESMALFDAGV